MLKVFQKTNISNPTHVKCEYKGGGERNVGFSENFAYVLQKWPKRKTWNKWTKTWNCLR